MFDEIKEETKKLGINEFVEFPGTVTYEQAKQLLSEANVFVHHSITARNGDTEGLPNALLEAMAMELPVISTYHSGIPELVEDGVNGFLVNEKDIDKYASKMKEIISWDYLPINREKVLKSFSKKIHNENLEKIYLKLISK